MGLSKSTKKLLVELVKNEDKLSQFLSELYDGKSDNEETKLNCRFGELRDAGFLHVQFGDNRAYVVRLTHYAEDYVAENMLHGEELSNKILKDILVNIKQNHDIATFLQWNATGGKSQISWRQVNEQEWEVRIEAIAGIMKVNKAFRELDDELKKYGFVQVESDEIHGNRFKKTVKYANGSRKSAVNSNKSLDRTYPQKIEFEQLLKDIRGACLILQEDKHLSEGSEDDKTRVIQKLLISKDYDVLDQTQKGLSVTGKQSGEVDLFIYDEQKNPFSIIEALILNSVNKSEIDLHVNKVTKYDLYGLMNNVILVYSYRKDFHGMVKGYIDYISENTFDYPLSDIKDISDHQFSELRLIQSTYERSGMKRNLFHILLNLYT